MNFPPEWAGFRFKGEWTEENCGGTPMRMTKEGRKLWAKNP